MLADGEDVGDLIPNDPAIRYIYRPSFGPIGAKRNAGCLEARGEIICHFDDDDHSAPDRVRQQIRSLLDTGKQVAGFHTLRFTDGRRWWRYHLRSSYVLGTTLCYTKSFWERNPFPEKQINEDGDFVRRAEGALVSADAGDLMFATIHHGNTSPRDLDRKQWTEITA